VAGGRVGLCCVVGGCSCCLWGLSSWCAFLCGGGFGKGVEAAVGETMCGCGGVLGGGGLWVGKRGMGVGGCGEVGGRGGLWWWWCAGEG